MKKDFSEDSKREQKRELIHKLFNFTIKQISTFMHTYLFLSFYCI